MFVGGHKKLEDMATQYLLLLNSWKCYRKRMVNINTKINKCIIHMLSKTKEK